jgi:pimeloyl-ACP methyl ester carboxylesterase
MMDKTKTSRSLWMRLLRWALVFIAIVIFGLYILLPVGIGVAVVQSGRETVGLPPAGFEPISLTTADQVSLEGWYAPPADGAAILLLHGAGGSRESVRPYAEMLERNGYGVLALDLRGHGASGGNTNRLGWEGSTDVGAAIEFLQSQPEVERIGGLGMSMGGEVLLGAAEKYPTLAAIAADGATHRSLDELLALPSERPLYRNFTARVMYAAVQLLSGDQPPAPLLESMIAAPDTQFLLVVGGAEPQEVAYNQLFAGRVGERASLWVVPDAAHTGGFSLSPGEYEQRVIGFFETALQASPDPAGK